MKPEIAQRIVRGTRFWMNAANICIDYQDEQSGIFVTERNVEKPAYNFRTKVNSGFSL